MKYRSRVSKYNAKKTIIDGITFDSKKEARRYCELELLKKAGEVSWFLRQVPFDCGGGIKYRLDFLIVWTSGEVTFEDVKGFKTATYKMKKKLVESRYPIEITEV
jgi:hypothetical protein